MTLLKAIGFGIILWIIIFFEVSILMFGFKLASGSVVYYVVHGILITIFTLVLAMIYFLGKKTKKGITQGLLVGFIWVVVGIILDAAITIPLFTHDYGFLLQPSILISELWGIVLCCIVSASVRKK